MSDPLGEFPDAATVSSQLDCGRQECWSTGECWTAGRCLRRHAQQHPSDPKGGARIVDKGAARRKCLREKECRIEDCGGVASDGHHIVYRSMGGDDIEDNLVPLCHHDHMTLHSAATDDYWIVREEIGRMLTDTEISYVIKKLGYATGTEFLERAYRVTDVPLRVPSLIPPEGE